MMDTPVETEKKNPLKIALQILVPLAITVALVWYMFTKIDFAELWETVRHGVDYKWILLAMGISVFSHVFRALRWRLQLRFLSIDPPLPALCCAIFGTYALNLVFPRLGEVWRCTYIAKRQHAPFTTVLGSMVSDRLCDTLTVALLLLFTLGVAHDQIGGFLDRYPLGADLVRTLSNPKTWVCAVAAILVCAVLVYALRHTRPLRVLRRWCSELWCGFASVTRLKGRGTFVLLTVGIWGTYFVQLYVAFFAFPCTRALIDEPGMVFGLLPALVAFVISSIGMAIPSNGGLGPWNMGIIFALGLYGVAEAPATSLSIVVWSAQTIMLIILGVFTAIYTSKKTTR